MPYTYQHGSPSTLLGAATLAGRADRQRLDQQQANFQQQRMDRLAQIADDAAMARDELRMREQARSLQDAATRTSQQFRARELGLSERGMTLSEKREERITKAADDQQAIITKGTGEAIALLDSDLASGRIDKMTHRTLRIATLTGNKTLFSEGMRRYTKTRTEEEVQRAKAMKDAEKYKAALNDPRMSPAQINDAAQQYAKVVSEGTERWGDTWQDDPFEYHQPDYETPTETGIPEGATITAWPANREDLVAGKLYPVPTKGNRIHLFDGYELILVAQPTKTKGKTTPKYSIKRSR